MRGKDTKNASSRRRSRCSHRAASMRCRCATSRLPSASRTRRCTIIFPQAGHIRRHRARCAGADASVLRRAQHPVRRLRRRDAVRGDERRAHARDGAAVVSLLLRGSVHGAPAPFAGDQPVRERGGGARLPPRVRRAAHGAAAHHLRAPHGHGRVRPRRRRADGRRTAGRPVHAHACGSDMGGSRTAARRPRRARFARAHTAAGRGIRGGERA